MFDLEHDPGETTDVARQHPDVVARLKQFVEQARDDLGDSAVARRGRHVRAAGRIRTE